ncbi:MAG: glycosyltransferase [Candidatus Omnitrophica bacterium]|nr:glycosyltransferase [Candidatus Omnitrophota bacterium]
MKILYLISGLDFGGAQQYLMSVVGALDREKYRPIICCMFYKGDFFNEIAEKGIDIRFLNIGRIYGISGLVGLFKLVRLSKRNKVDIIHSLLFSENILGSIAGKIAGVKVNITSRRDTGMLREGKWQHVMAYNITNRWVDKIVCVSNAVREVTRKKEGVSDDRLVTIYNGIDVNKLSCLYVNKSLLRESMGIKEHESVVGMVANFSWIKGHKDFVEAARLILKEIPNVKFLLIGDGPLLQTYKAITSQSRQLKERVIFLGKRKDVRELLSLMDVSVNASYSEGMSNSILESMAAGVPVVATAVDGNLETIIDGQTGYLVTPKSPHKMAEAIIKLLEDKELAAYMGCNARKLVQEKFNFTSMVDRVKSLYNELLSPKIGFILSQFPETHETFILREFKAMKDVGMKFRIFSLKLCRDKVVHPEAKELMEETIYGRLGFIFNPFRVLSALVYLIRTYYKAPKEFLKALYVLSECFYFAGIIKKEKISHIHSHWATMPTTSAVIISKLTGIPFSFTAHAWDIFVSQYGLKEKIEKAGFVVTCTEYNRRYLAELAGEGCAGKIYRNYHGLEDEWFNAPHPIPLPLRGRGNIELLVIGRLVEQKGFEYLIEACAKLRNKGYEFKLRIVGEGPLGGRLKLRVRSLALEERIEFLGLRGLDEIKRLYREADIFIAPSVIAANNDRDGIPNVILEAMAMGLPVIGTDVSGLPEVLVNNKTGLVVPERNPEALNKAIERLIKNTEIRKRLGRQAKDYIRRNFDLSINAGKLVNIFESNAAERRIKILYLIWSLEPGGAERVVIDLARNINRKHFEPYVCCINKPGSLSCELTSIGIPVLHLDKKTKVDPLALLRLISIMRRYDFDMIHTHMFTSNLWGRLAGFFASKKFVIITEHSTEEWKRAYHFLIDRALLPLTKKAIFVTEKVLEFYKEKIHIPEKMSFVCNNGVDTSRLRITNTRKEVRDSLGISMDSFLIGAVGRLAAPKNFQNLLKALSKIKDGVETVIVGDGPEREDLVRMRDNLGLSGTVKFLGVRSDIGNILNAIDILVVPSKREGLSLTILEAMSMGVPVIATDVGGNSECVINGKTGFLVPSEAPEALGRAILKAVSDKKILTAMGNRAKKLFKSRFTVDSMIKTHENVYEEILGKGLL